MDDTWEDLKELLITQRKDMIDANNCSPFGIPERIFKYPGVDLIMNTRVVLMVYCSYVLFVNDACMVRRTRTRATPIMPI